MLLYANRLCWSLESQLYIRVFIQYTEYKTKPTSLRRLPAGCWSWMGVRVAGLASTPGLDGVGSQCGIDNSRSKSLVRVFVFSSRARTLLAAEVTLDTSGGLPSSDNDDCGCWLGTLPLTDLLSDISDSTASRLRTIIRSISWRRE